MRTSLQPLKQLGILAGLCAGLLVGHTAAIAGRADMKLELGGFAGAHFWSDRNELGRYPGDPVSNALKHGGMFGLRLGFVLHPRVALEGELALMPASTRGAGVQVMGIGYRLNLLVHILTGRWKPFVLVGGGGLSSSSANPDIFAQDTDGEIHAGVGLKVAVKDNWGIRVDGRVIFGPAIGIGNNDLFFTQDYEVNAGIYGLWDLCKKKEEPQAAPAPAPKPVADTDGDGIADDKDQCPADKGIAENNGCPDKDGDGDTVVDRLDKCPAQAGIVENGGCPDVDSDGDTVVDRLDKCPADKGVVENGGCPDTDEDKDGVVDRLDQCKDKPETANGYQDEDGCPDEIPQAVKEFTGVIKGINFKSGKAVITADSYPLLDKAVKVLEEFTDVKLEVQGHTDNAGKREKNLKLSQERADAVRAYFLGKGVKPERIKATGFGPDKPVADNKSSKGRAENRRVEFQLVK